jgi:hypothetical protein
MAFFSLATTAAAAPVERRAPNSPPRAASRGVKPLAATMRPAAAAPERQVANGRGNFRPY